MKKFTFTRKHAGWLMYIGLLGVLLGIAVVSGKFQEFAEIFLIMMGWGLVILFLLTMFTWMGVLGDGK